LKYFGIDEFSTQKAVPITVYDAHHKKIIKRFLEKAHFNRALNVLLYA
jgi:hypothetical protein